MKSMEAVRPRTCELHAALYEIERGLFCTTYPGREPGFDRMPRYQLGASVADAKRRIEQYARRCGFDAVIWSEDFSATAPASFRDERPAGDAGGAHCRS